MNKLSVHCVTWLTLLWLPCTKSKQNIHTKTEKHEQEGPVPHAPHCRRPHSRSRSLTFRPINLFLSLSPFSIRSAKKKQKKNWTIGKFDTRTIQVHRHSRKVIQISVWAFGMQSQYEKKKSHWPMIRSIGDDEHKQAPLGMTVFVRKMHFFLLCTWGASYMHCSLCI